jgi:hypothetical protein
MNIYRPYPSDLYDSFYLIDTNKKDDIIDRFLNRGKYQNVEERGEWPDINVEIESLGTKRGDFFGISACSIICNMNAWKVLKPLIDNSVKLLPIIYKDDTYFLLKATNIVDCLDYTRASILRSPKTGRVLGVNKYAFKESCIKDENFFVIPEIKFDILVSQKFKDCVEQNRLEGLLFQQLEVET